MTYKRIIVPVDGSETSDKGLAEAIQLAGNSDAKLLLLHLVDEYPAFASPDPGLNIAPIVDVLRANGQKVIDRAASFAKAAGASPETLLVENFAARVAEAIVEQAVHWKADLIVMGTHGRRGVNRAIMGSDAELVARYSPVPLLLVPPAGRASSFNSRKG